MGECTAEDKRLCYVPMPSLGHELGILFGFIGTCSMVDNLGGPRLSLCRSSRADNVTALMLVCMLAYGFAWQIGNRRSLRKEEERIAALRASGHLRDEKSSTESGVAANRA